MFCGAWRNQSFHGTSKKQKGKSISQHTSGLLPMPAPATSTMSNGSLSLSGIARRFPVENHVQRIIRANPRVLFDVLLAPSHSHGGINDSAVAILRAEPNVRAVDVIDLPAEPAECYT